MFFYFLASHDGIGLRPVESLLDQAAIAKLVKTVQKHHGLVSYKTNSDGSQSAYELNINYFDALNNPNGDETLELQIRRFLSAHSILLTLAGVPGIYVHSLLGSRNDYEGVKHTGRNRSINREKFDLKTLEQALADPANLRTRVLTEMKKPLKARQSFQAFHPQANQEILNTQKEVFGIKRSSHSEVLYCLHNVSQEQQTVKGFGHGLRDAFSQEKLERISLEPLASRWVIGH